MNVCKEGPMHKRFEWLYLHHHLFCFLLCTLSLFLSRTCDLRSHFAQNTLRTRSIGRAGSSLSSKRQRSHRVNSIAKSGIIAIRGQVQTEVSSFPYWFQGEPPLNLGTMTVLKCPDCFWRAVLRLFFIILLFKNIF